MTHTEVAYVYFELAPTATYRRRRIGFFPGDKLGDSRSATLRIVQEKAKRSRERDEIDEYGVVETFERVHNGARAFLLRNPDNPVDTEFYRVEVYLGAGPKWATCTCRAGTSRTAPSCKHRDGLLKVIEEGVLCPLRPSRRR